MTSHTHTDKIYTMKHHPDNTHVKVAGIVHEVSSARWCYGMVAYCIAGTGNMVYSWEQAVEAVDNA